ncbi:acyltransferase family protein [Salinactinospora qingdaonensis]|uniref:Acyltransferase family protein n=1 Tax=Salinactinospora qingdaonensis TaxID=702744 RepID=A0ABP7FXA9_9ACTN
MTAAPTSLPSAPGDNAPGARPTVAPRSEYRPEVQGLRAVAVLLVAVYHIWLGRVSGGVDVFLLITGFLITGSLLRSVERQGRIRYLAFWTRLLNRLAPSAGLVLLGILTASALWLPTAQWRDVIAETFAAALYHENWYLATNAVDYLARDSSISPVQHFWSLSIQGQFYLLWPLLVTLAAVIARWCGQPLRRVVMVALVAVMAGSLGYSVWITATNQAWAYFDTGARLWELALGGILAIVLPHLAFSPRLRLAMGWVGLVGLVSCGLLLQVSTLFPGWIALWPTGAAVLVILAGTTGSRFGADRLLTWRPLDYIGDLSYALYLWHWPVLAIYLSVAGRTVASLHGGLLVLAVSVALAAATKWLMEDGVGRLTRGRKSLLWPLAVGVACLLPAVTAAGVWESRLDRQEQAQVETADQQRDRYPGAAVLMPGFSGTLPEAPVLPSPVNAHNDQGDNKEPGGCHDLFEATTATPCVDGPADAERTLVLVGQSHAAHWYTALRDAAVERGWRLVSMTKDACQFSTEPSYRGEDEYLECEPWNQDVMRRIADIDPDLVITTATRSSAGNGESVLDGYAQRWRELDAMGIPVLGIRDTPRMATSAAQCVAEHGPDAAECTTDFTRSLAEVPPYEGMAGVPASMSFIDLNDYFCPQRRCQSVIGNVLVYYDDSHITATYSATLAPVVGAEIERVTGW